LPSLERTKGIAVLDILISTYNYLDLTPLGRNEKDLPYTMSWLRHHDRYPDSA
jgi:predicted dithiol-disulfide oxidoreductase (DUF899 family)